MEQLTKRELIAAIAMGGLLHYGVGMDALDDETAESAVNATDALLRVLARPTSPRSNEGHDL